MFHIYVASVLSGCCICFTHMLHVFYLDVAYVLPYVATICFKCFIYVRRKLHLSVSRVPISDGHTAQVLGWDAAELGTGNGQGVRARRGAWSACVRRKNKSTWYPTSCLVPKIFQDSPSHRMFRHMYRVLNVDEK
jgi:hypothetical protein